MTEQESFDPFDPWQFHDEDWNLALGPAWAPSQSLTNATLTALGSTELWLADAINLMAFGVRADLNAEGCFRNDPDIGPDGKVYIENIVGRIRAARVLFDAVKAEELQLFGSPIEGGDTSDAIPSDYFSMSTPRALGHKDNTIETDLNRVSFEDFKAAREGKHQRWWKVTVETASFVRWLTGELKIAGVKTAEASDDDARAVLHDAMDKNGGFIGQEAGAKIVREKYPGFNKKRAMKLVKELTGNKKSGPRGPRKDRA